MKNGDIFRGFSDEEIAKFMNYTCPPHCHSCTQQGKPHEKRTCYNREKATECWMEWLEGKQQ